jgi:acyl-CoA dehydrogenase
MPIHFDQSYAAQTEFRRPIGKNQGVQFPIARAYARVDAASLMVEKAASLFDAGEPCGAEAKRLYQVAPISTNLLLSYVAEHVLGLQRSF